MQQAFPMTRPAFYLIILLLAVVPSMAPAVIPQRVSIPPVNRWSLSDITEAIFMAADEFNVPLEIALKQALAESDMIPTAVSPKNARGLFQILAKYQAELLAYYLPGTTDFDVWNPYHNARLAMAYLRGLKEEFGDWWGAVAAYNCGPARYENFVMTGEPLPRETIYYLRNIFGGTRGLERKLG